MTADAGPRRSPRATELAPLALGVGALVAGTAFGWDARLVDLVVTPPAIVRAALVALAAIVGGWLLVAGLRRIGDRGVSGTGAGPADGAGIRTMIRGVRLVFLGVAAFAAAVGWFAGHPLPLVIALIIAGIDVIETSFLLLVVRTRSPG